MATTENEATPRRFRLSALTNFARGLDGSLRILIGVFPEAVSSVSDLVSGLLDTRKFAPIHRWPVLGLWFSVLVVPSATVQIAEMTGAFIYAYGLMASIGFSVMNTMSIWSSMLGLPYKPRKPADFTNVYFVSGVLRYKGRTYAAPNLYSPYIVLGFWACGFVVMQHYHLAPP